MWIFLIIVILVITAFAVWYKKNEPWQYKQKAIIIDKVDGKEFSLGDVLAKSRIDNGFGLGYGIPPGAGYSNGESEVMRPTTIWTLKCDDGLEDSIPSSRFHGDIVLESLDVGSEVEVVCKKSIVMFGREARVDCVERVISRAIGENEYGADSQEFELSDPDDGTDMSPRDLREV